MTDLTLSPAWKALSAHRDAAAAHHMRDLFASDPSRFETLSRRTEGIFIDISKNNMTAETLVLLIDLARERGVEDKRDAMFRGSEINETEGRAVLHPALRAKSRRYFVDGSDVSTDVARVLDKMEVFAADVHEGRWRGATGERITAAVNIGIGGSHKGPQLVAQALHCRHREGFEVRFVSNVDGHQLAETLEVLDPATTLFLIASKTFTTDETMTNARTARDWVTAALGPDAVARHFVALSTNLDAVAEFGIDPNNAFAFWDWVGGRYSVWSAIGLAAALAVGMDDFRIFLAGGEAMDEHFRSAPLEDNLPVLLALVGIWNVNFLGRGAHAVLPYDHRLRSMPGFLSQLDMESNGKSVTLTGEPVSCATGPVVFGEPGTDGQHSFHQSLHQGTAAIPADFIAVANPDHGFTGHHEKLLANALAQSQALMVGRDAAEAGGNPHRAFPGNRPSNTILLERLDPFHLGQLIALYEHKVFVQGVIWGINSFDQWGVELGKQLARDLLGDDDGGRTPDSSTEGLGHILAAWREDTTE